MNSCCCARYAFRPALSPAAKASIRAPLSPFQPWKARSRGRNTSAAVNTSSMRRRRDMASRASAVSSSATAWRAPSSSSRVRKRSTAAYSPSLAALGSSAAEKLSACASAACTLPASAWSTRVPAGCCKRPGRRVYGPARKALRASARLAARSSCPLSQWMVAPDGTSGRRTGVSARIYDGASMAATASCSTLRSGVKAQLAALPAPLQTRPAPPASRGLGAARVVSHAMMKRPKPCVASCRLSSWAALPSSELAPMRSSMASCPAPRFMLL
ncbi:hypothetical protein JaAD80_27775 [Janthinobacterium sp. AD80]|nr:hypothetical protein JaAD80_27775 [Janthinobacterium sp. AD80]